MEHDGIIPSGVLQCSGLIKDLYCVYVCINIYLQIYTGLCVQLYTYNKYLGIYVYTYFLLCGMQFASVMSYSL